MLNRVDLLDPNAVETRSEYEKKVIEGAQNAGNGPRRLYLGRVSSGALQQFINPAAIKAAGCGCAPGCDCDISDGLSSIAEAVAGTGDGAYEE